MVQSKRAAAGSSGPLFPKTRSPQQPFLLGSFTSREVATGLVRKCCWNLFILISPSDALGSGGLLVRDRWSFAVLKDCARLGRGCGENPHIDTKPQKNRLKNGAYSVPNDHLLFPFSVLF